MNEHLVRRLGAMTEAQRWRVLVHLAQAAPGSVERAMTQVVQAHHRDVPMVIKSTGFEPGPEEREVA